MSWLSAHKREVTIAAVAVTLVGLFTWLMLWLFLTHEGTATVIDTTWLHVVQLRQREQHHGEGWRRNMPSSAFNVSCYERADGEEPCWDDSEKMCTSYSDWCTYDYYEWPVIAQKQDGGDTHDVRWPEMTKTGPNQRIDRIATYKVKFRGTMGEDKGKVWDKEISGLPSWRRFNRGDYWRVKTNRAGMIWPLYRLQAEGA